MAKRGNGEGSIRQRKNGLWEGQYVTGRDGNGKLQKKSVYGKTKKEVVEKLATITTDIRTGLFLPPEKITVSEWSEVWTKDYLVDVTDSTANQYKYQFRVHILPELGSVKLQKLTGAMVQSFYQKAQTPHNIKVENKTIKSRGLSPKSLKNLHGVLHSCLDQAIKVGYIKFNPCDACVLPKVVKKEMNTITDINQFFDIISGEEFENVYIFAVFTGMRQSEIIGLTWDCVDFENRIIKVDKQFRKDHGQAGEEYKFTATKNGKQRIISPAQFVFDALKKEKAKQAKNKLKHGEGFSNKNNLVFTNETGGHLCGGTIYDHWKALLKVHGIEKNIRFHDLRHSFATISLENGEDIKTVSENLGHATVAFTMDTYAHVTDAMKKRSGDRMQEYIERARRHG